MKYSLEVGRDNNGSLFRRERLYCAGKEIMTYAGKEIMTNPDNDRLAIDILGQLDKATGVYAGCAKKLRSFILGWDIESSLLPPLNCNRKDTSLACLDNPEQGLYPMELKGVAQKLNNESQQLIISTHSPILLNYFHPEQVRILYRGDDGYTRIKPVTEITGIKAFLEEGAKLGELWMEGHFD